MLTIDFRWTDTAGGHHTDRQTHWPCVPRVGECVSLSGKTLRVVSVVYVREMVTVSGGGYGYTNAQVTPTLELEQVP